MKFFDLISYALCIFNIALGIPVPQEGSNLLDNYYIYVILIINNK